MLPQEFVPLLAMTLFHVIVTVEAVQCGFGDVNPPVCTKNRSLHIGDVVCNGYCRFLSCANQHLGYCLDTFSNQYLSQDVERIKGKRSISINPWRGPQWLCPKEHHSVWWMLCWSYLTTSFGFTYDYKCSFKISEFFQWCWLYQKNKWPKCSEL